MPRLSQKKVFLNRLDSLELAGRKHARVLKLFGVSSSIPDDFVHCCRSLRRKVSSCGYLSRGPHRKRTSKFCIYLETNHADAITDREFLFYFRMSGEAFATLVRLVEGHKVFHRPSADNRGAAPKPCVQQLLVLLRHFGTEGNACSSAAIASFFGVGAGVVDSCEKSALEALLTLEEHTCIWPDEDERKIIAKRIKEKHFFPHCVGLIDGALLPLAERPLIHGENYMSRKKFYAIAMLVVCDDLGRALHCHVGWPGSVHDNRVWRNCSLFNECDERFSPKQHLLGDTAFTASSIVVPPFKCTPGVALDSNRVGFNTLLARPRVKSEHCMGTFKGRLPFFSYDQSVCDWEARKTCCA